MPHSKFLNANVLDLAQHGRNFPGDCLHIIGRYIHPNILPQLLDVTNPRASGANRIIHRHMPDGMHNIVSRFVGLLESSS